MTIGERVWTPDGTKGMVVGWRGDNAVVSLDGGGYVEVPVSSLRRAR